MHLRSCALAPSVLCIGLKTWMRGKNDTWSMSDRLSTVRVAWTPRRLPQTNGRVEEAAKMLRCSFNGPERRRLAGSGRSTKPDVEVRRSLRTRQRKIAAPACFRHRRCDPARNCNTAAESFCQVHRADADPTRLEPASRPLVVVTASKSIVGESRYWPSAHAVNVWTTTDRCQLSAADIHIFSIPLDNLTPAHETCLDTAERDRTARFVFDRDRRRYARAHAAMREILGGFLGRPPAEIRFGVGTYGKPYVHDAGVDLRFNLSHSGERALLAVSYGREVGVDVEENRPVDWLPLAHRFFAAREVAELEAMPASEQMDAFFRCWTRKEAFLKAHGMGLSAPLNAFEVDLTPNDCAQLLRACHLTPAMREHWRIVSLAVDVGYVAALAAEAGDWRICYSDAAWA